VSVSRVQFATERINPVFNERSKHSAGWRANFIGVRVDDCMEQLYDRSRLILRHPDWLCIQEEIQLAALS